MATRIVLCVEPDEASEAAIRGALTSHGFEIKNIANGEKAIEWGRKNPPALVIVSIEPRRGGLRHLQQACSQTTSPAAGPSSGSRTHRQSCDRHRLEPRARAGERARAGGRRVPRVPLRARRRAARRSGASKSKPSARRPSMVLDRAGRRVDAPRASSSSSSTHGRDVRRPRHPRQQRRPRRRRRTCSTRPTPSGRRRSTRRCFRRSARRALAVPHMRQRGGGAIVMIASIWGRESGGRMTYNAVKAAEISLGEVAGAAARAAQHPRQQRRARLDPVSRRIVAQAPAGRSRRASPSSSGASCRSAASAAPKKSAPSSRSSPRPLLRAGRSGRTADQQLALPSLGVLLDRHDQRRQSGVDILF